MNAKLYIGNLSFKAQEEELSELFSPYGEVKSARIITDRDSGRSRGFAFVEMGDDEQASKALEALDGQEHFGRTLKVSIAKERESRGPRPGGGGGFGNR